LLLTIVTLGVTTIVIEADMEALGADRFLSEITIMDEADILSQVSVGLAGSIRGVKVNAIIKAEEMGMVEDMITGGGIEINASSATLKNQEESIVLWIPFFCCIIN